MGRRRAKGPTLGELQQAVITGLLCGLSGAALLMLAEYPKAYGGGAAFGLLCTLLAWLSYRGEAARYNTAQGGDTEQGAQGGDTEQDVQVNENIVRVELLQEDDKAGAFIDLPVTPDQLRILADGLAAGRQFAQSSWTGAGQPFARSEFVALRAELLRRGLAKWNREGAAGQGVSITAAGRAVLRHFQTPPPHPED